MNAYQKYFLVEPSAWFALKNSQLTSNEGKIPVDVSLPQFNKERIEKNELNENLSQQNWANVSKKVEPILSSAFSSIQLPSSPLPPQPPPLAPPSTISSPVKVSKTDQILDEIRSSISPNYINKAIQLYSYLHQLPGVKVDSKSISIDGEPIFGTMITHLSQLIKPNNYLSFVSNALLKKISTRPEIMRLIANKQAQSILASFHSPASSPQKKSPVKKLEKKPNLRSRAKKVSPIQDINSSESEFYDARGNASNSTDTTIDIKNDDDDEDYVDDDEDNNNKNQSGSGIKKTKKRKFIWKSLF